MSDKYPGRFNYFYLDTSQVSAHVTSTSEKIQLFWDNLRKLKTPIILFIDECDELMSSRMNAGHIRVERTSNIMKQLNNEIPNLFIIAATNRPKQIDRAVLERFSNRIPCEIPTDEELRQILDIHLTMLTENQRLHLLNAIKLDKINSGEHLDKNGKKVPNHVWSGRDIKHLADAYNLRLEVARLSNPEYQITDADVVSKFSNAAKAKRCLKMDYLED